MGGGGVLGTLPPVVLRRRRKKFRPVNHNLANFALLFFMGSLDYLGGIVIALTL